MLLSVPFLLVTLGIYAFIKELRNIHGKCFMCCITGLIFFYLSFAIIQLLQEKLLQWPWLCKLTGCVAYISTMICFFWLSVMGYDIWSTFRFVVCFICTIKRFHSCFCRNGLRGHSGNQNRFKFFCVYGFGVPVVLAAIVVLIDNTNFVPLSYRPSIGEDSCWMSKDMKVEAIYVYLPIFLIITSNTGFFSATAYKIFCVQKETSHVRKGGSGRHASTTVDTARYEIS